ncbi:MAG TPA: hypothetical protein VGO56_00465 [Pyrinomonadaceae bacterium]|jgi:hypothetical protein|nr:hypothetical protein [Pyrinomonadaceae bacterium]
MSGGVVTVAVALYERLSAHNVPVWVYIAILVGFAFCACYLAWRDAVRKATVLEKALKENKRQKLTFQINQKRSLAYIHQETGDLTCIQAAVTLQFKNHEQYPITLEDIVLELYERFDEKSEEKKIGTLMYGEPWFHKLDALEPQEFRGRTLDHGFSDWFKFRSMIAIANDITPEQLDGWKHRLRLTVVAMNQEPLSATLFVDWAKAAEKPTTCFPVWPRSLAMPERYHIIGSSKGDEEVDSQGFVIFTKGTTDKVESSD